MKTLLFSLLTFAVLASTASATVTLFNFQGLGGFGLLSTNETGTVSGTPGSGGEVGAGISFDDATNALTLNFAWGSANGFTNLTGNAIAGHIHGATTGNAPASFGQNAGVMIGLDSLGGWNNNASSGGFTGTVTLTGAQAANLFQGRLYVNIHTSLNGAGEIRGNLVAVPEPTRAILLMFATGLLALRRRR